MQIKLQRGRMGLRLSLPDLIEDQRQRGLQILQVSLNDIFALGALPPHHRDPFDRLLVAQGCRGGYELVTCDPLIQQYDVPTLW